VLVATLTVAGLLAGACGSSRESGHGAVASRPAATQTIALTVLTLADDRVPALPSLLAPGDRVVVRQRIAFTDGDDAVTALQHGRRVDVLVTCSDEYPPDLARAGLLQPLDTQRLPGLNAIVPAMRALPGTTVDGRLYAVPLEAGVVGIVYDPRAVTRPPVSFRAFFSRSATGRVAMIDSPVLGLQIGALALGYREPAALSDAQLLQVTVLYEKRRDNFSFFWRRRSGLLRAFRSGEITLAAATESDALWLREHGIPVQFVPGAEGGLLWACLAGIPASAPHPGAAYAFLRSALSPAAWAAKAARYHAASLSGDSLTTPGSPPPEVALLTTTDAQRAVTVVRPADEAAWLIAWTKAKQPRRPGCG
jgi:spermidine/putrescine-binding protein